MSRSSCAMMAPLMLALASTAHAQTNTPLDRFEPAPAGDVFVFVPSADVPGGLRPSANIAMSIATSPLVLVDTRTEGTEIADVVSHQLALHGLVAFGLFHRLKLELDVPVTITQGGDDPAAGGIVSTSPSGPAMNDIRLGARLLLLGQHDYWPSVSTSLTGWFPSGDDEAYTSSGSVRLAPALLIGADYDSFVWSTAVSRRFDTGSDENLLGSEIAFGVAAGPRLGPVLLSAEIWGSTVSQRGTTAFSTATTNVEAHLAVRYDLGPLVFRLAAGPGLTTGVGTPDFRMVAMVGYAPEVPNAWRRQQQLDRVEDAASGTTVPRGSLPRGPGAGRAGQPRDGDGDGVSDALDACPAVAGARTASRPGCPPDADRDGVFDRDDACPSLAGPRDPDPKRDGCPGDRDGDGIVDASDACVDTAGKANADPKKNGCPEAVRIVGGQLLILDKIAFETGSGDITAASEPTLQQVADVLNAQPTIVRVAIEGHTDNVGDENANIALSQTRALAVMRWLIEHGVDERRLEARGYGPRQPLTSNDSPEGRAKNRRVDFRILERNEQGKAAWRDGAVE